MSRRPLVALHRSTGTNTFVAGRIDAGSVNATGLVPVVAMAPWKWTTPEIVLAAALAVPKGPLVQPFCSVSGVYPPGLVAKDTPSRDVKHWALANTPPWACTVTTPVLWAMNSRPLVALHMSTGT